MPRWQTADLPAAGVWRVGRGDDPLWMATPVGADLGDSRAGNRFDSLTGAFRVLYFGTDLETCFGETLSRYRADPKLAFIDEEWEANRFMARGTVPKDWRMRRTAVRVAINTDRRFLDVEALGTRKRLLRLLGPVLALFEVEDLDVATIRGPDRRVGLGDGQEFGSGLQDRVTLQLLDVDVVEDRPAFPTRIDAGEITETGKHSIPSFVDLAPGPLGDESGESVLTATPSRQARSW